MVELFDVWEAVGSETKIGGWEGRMWGREGGGSAEGKQRKVNSRSKGRLWALDRNGQTIAGDRN